MIDIPRNLSGGTEENDTNLVQVGRSSVRDPPRTPSTTPRRSVLRKISQSQESPYDWPSIGLSPCRAPSGADGQIWVFWPSQSCLPLWGEDASVSCQKLQPVYILTISYIFSYILWCVHCSESQLTFRRIILPTKHPLAFNGQHSIISQKRELLLEVQFFLCSVNFIFEAFFHSFVNFVLNISTTVCYRSKGADISFANSLWKQKHRSKALVEGSGQNSQGQARTWSSALQRLLFTSNTSAL